MMTDAVRTVLKGYNLFVRFKYVLLILLLNGKPILWRFLIMMYIGIYIKERWLLIAITVYKSYLFYIIYKLPELFKGVLILKNEYWLKDKNNSQEN